MVKLAAFFVVWGDQELLKHSIKHIRPLVDGVIVIYSTISNFGEEDKQFDFEEDTEYFKFTPDFEKRPAENERAKRNLGLEKCIELGYTHFIMLDADEFYEPEAFTKEKIRLINSDLIGLVCPLICYFRTPELFVEDHTLVPFIHKIIPSMRFERNNAYPFTVHNDKYSIDPTRQLNIVSGVGWSDITMHHMSWVRSDVRKKIRNSTARANLEKSTIIEDYRNAKEGVTCNFYHTTLKKSKNIFHLPEIIDQTL